MGRDGIVPSPAEPTSRATAWGGVLSWKEYMRNVLMRYEVKMLIENVFQ